MKKKILALILTLVMAGSISTGFTAAAAGPTSIPASSSVLRISNEKKVEMMVEATNKTILLLVKIAQLTPKNDVDTLVQATNELAFKTIQKAAELGVSVVCEYEAYEVDGQIVYIDPLRIINR